MRQNRDPNYPVAKTRGRIKQRNPNTPLWEVRRGIIIGLHREGLNNSEIARRLGCTPANVRTILIRLRRDGLVD